ncbi:MAG TPA: DPP IV N-terminal domain-containing protein [Bacteroidota bacterium]|nr:DPP IV N-terminal domain-containing protein [Bacteroidota bacterium]
MKSLSYCCAALLCALCIIPAARAQDEFYHPELEWRSIETDHFFVHYHLGTERTARIVAKIAEEIYEPVTTLYNHKPDGKVSFVIKDYDDYSNGAAYFLDNKIEIWASSLDFDLRGTHNWLRNVITHEFTHVVQIQTSLKFGRRVPAIYFQWFQYENERRPDVLYGFPNAIVSYPISGFTVPSWFAEGVAQYNRKELGYDKWDAHRDMILRMYSLDNNMLTWNEMSVFGKTSLGNESSYNAGFAFVRYIGQRYGDDKLREISKNLSSLTALTIDGAIEKATGKPGKDLYDEWREYLRTDYGIRVAGLRQHLSSDTIIANVGFGNFYPTFSPDGKSIAYVSNKEADYFGLSALYLYDVAEKKEKLLKGGVRSDFSWSPDGKKIYYSRTTRRNDHWSNVFDLYVYDIEREDEQRLTHGSRANSPAVSPDGAAIAYVAGADGTINLYTMNIDGTNIRQLTSYHDGEQIFNPKWSPDGQKIIFDYSIKDGRDIATVSSSGGEVSFVLATPRDERNAIFTPDGSSIIFSCDSSGIFNLYELHLGTNDVRQLTNVLGGAFMPTTNAAGQLAFATYTSTGYKIAFMNSLSPMEDAASYAPASAQPEPVSMPGDHMSGSGDSFASRQFAWDSLRHYDDRTVPTPVHETGYRNVATSLTFLPLIRVDNYNTKSKGIDVIKVGLYAYSYDMIDRYGLLAGAAFNRKGERDLFASFEYRGKVPGLYQLGLEPAVSFEAYNITRESQDASLSIEGRPDINIPVTVTYSLVELDLVMKQKVWTEALELEARYAHSRYSANVGSFFFFDPLSGDPPFLNSAFSNLYFVGNDVSATWRFEAINPSRTSEINPTGRKIRLRYDYEFNKFNPNSEYEVSNGLLVPKYQYPRFHRLEARWRESQPLPGWKHTLSVEARGGSILGPPQDDFFDFYIGGLTGMKGYPFYSIGGNEYASANVTYRFPLIEHIDLRVLQLYFDKLYASLYGDAGTAWTGGGVSGQRFRRDAGIELRLQAFSYYTFPTSIFFNATYGFDQFDRYVSTINSNVTYGKEWNFHFGVLFGFDLD